MAFTREPSRAPTAIADVSMQLYDPDPTGSEVASASFSVQVAMSDGSVMVRTGDLAPHITTAQRNSLLAFMAALRTKAIAEILT